MLHFRGQAYQMKNWSLEKKMRFDMDLMDEVNTMYKYVNYLFITCIHKNLKLVMENPFSEEHFLRRYWCYKPALIDMNRQENGDFFVKPTMYWFLNCEPKNNFLLEPVTYHAIGIKDANKKMVKSDWEKTGAKSKKTARSMIHPDYASRFIRQYLIE